MKLAVVLQYVLPHRLLSRLAYALARWRWLPFKRAMIDTVVRRFNVNLSEAEHPDPDSYPHFNAFFTRTLKAGARQADSNPLAILSPADGKISQAGHIESGRIVQAKGQWFSASELLGSDSAAAVYADGDFVNIYLSPRDYHRVHMPMAGTLRETLHIPGRLFSVAPWAVRAIPRLFARNERLVCHFDTDHGPLCVVMVGAMLVSGVQTVWGGEEIPPYASRPRVRDWHGKGITLARFAEMARFNYGSTVIMLWPANTVALDTLGSDQALQVGERIGALHADAKRATT
ncbi:MAG: archaetidylserine decarboxylase [Xanthomonadaceae bacterium]|nr:archaetidylserine decarboxylase [Xanthomonadaceae bacterium]MDP2185314.1 archaetidylserine decarboxylase [Xanthomonadales bacterium]MDZ4115852.1 archaetidylserine decarboxylase [Xanthomonadaceae bacterium]MDZ4378682.1 archaetidylserine decarboxylase [Xanthomonadaceae bacterium]